MAQQTTKRKRLTKKSCKQISALVLAYLNDELSPQRKQEFQQHLKICPDCVNFLKTYKKTIQATGTLALDEMPSKVRDNVWQFIHRKLRA